MNAIQRAILRLLLIILISLLGSTRANGHNYEILIKALNNTVDLLITDLVTGSQTLQIIHPESDVWSEYDWVAESNGDTGIGASYVFLPDRPYQLKFLFDGRPSQIFTYISCASQFTSVNNSEYPDYCPIGMDTWLPEIVNADDLYIEVDPYSRTVTMWSDGYSNQAFDNLMSGSWTIPFDLEGLHYYLHKGVVNPVRGRFTDPSFSNPQKIPLGTNSISASPHVTKHQFCLYNGFSSSSTYNHIPYYTLTGVYRYLNSNGEWTNTGGSYYQFTYVQCSGSFSGSGLGKAFGAEVAERSSQIKFRSAPNPFTSQVMFLIDLPESGKISLTLYDTVGREVYQLANGQEFTQGNHVLRFDASALAAGIYMYRLKVGDFIQSGSIIAVK